MNRLLPLPALLLLAWNVVAQPAAPGDARELKAQAYRLYEEKKFTEAASQFQAYLARSPNDARALFDYAALLGQLNRHQDAATQLELLHQRFPQHEVGYFRLATTYVALNRPADAQRVFTELTQSTNPEMAAAASAALQKLREDEGRAARTKAETHVFELARASQYADVVAAVNELERQGPISFALQMQRLYALDAQHEYPAALTQADRMAVTHPQAVDLALVRADLLSQLGRRIDAETIWRRIAREHPGTSAALEASRRLQQPTLPPLEDRVFTLVRQEKHQEAIAIIDEMEKKGALAWPMEMQRLYSWEALGEEQRALDRADDLTPRHEGAADLALFRADALIRRHELQKAGEALRQIEENQPGTPEAKAAADRLRAMPPIANLDKLFWGEAYASGDYLGRYDTVVGSGFIREGVFIPGARWLQPFAEFRFGVDTGSDTGPRATIVEDNAVGIYGGVRAQLLPTEYLFVYGQGGVNKDLLGRREHGDWASDYQAGIYGFKSWGPGTVFHPHAPGAEAGAAVSTETSARPADEKTANTLFWRGDWFADAGANFSYYHRYHSAIGYAQFHEGFRVAQYGPKLALDAYLIENVTWDVKGNFYDNYAEFGPGARMIWMPQPSWQVVLSVDWFQGYYFGRDEQGTRGNASGDYNGVHVGLAVGARW